MHIQEILAAARADPGSPVAARAQPALIVPETKDLGALLRELRRTRQQLAVVADEYGGTAGIVTMEDMLEEIVGEIEGEYELPDDTLTRVDDHTLLVAGSMTIDDFNEAVGTQLPQDVVRTMAGLVFSALGRRPQPRRHGDCRLDPADGRADGRHAHHPPASRTHTESTSRVSARVPVTRGRVARK